MASKMLGVSSLPRSQATGSRSPSHPASLRAVAKRLQEATVQETALGMIIARELSTREVLPGPSRRKLHDVLAIFLLRIHLGPIE